MGPSMIVDGDMQPARRRAMARRAASMGPSMIVDGDNVNAGTPSCRANRFNGAVDDRRGRRVEPVRGGDPRRASMGPSMIVDGDRRLPTASGTRRSSFNGAVE